MCFHLKFCLFSFCNCLKGAYDTANHFTMIFRSWGDTFFSGFLWILACAIVIASVGLNVNSTAVIIGAMLISPLMGPIVGAGFSLGTFDFPLFKKSIKNLIIATVVSLIVSTLYFFLSPFKETQSELLARTSPNIYDVLIAFFGGLVGVIAITRVEKGNPIPGVAIATALMPPLCTAGYGLAIGNFSFFFGAIYLYTINCVFICIATFAIVKYLKYPSSQNFSNKVSENRVKQIIYGLILVMIIPSVFFANQLFQEKKSFKAEKPTQESNNKLFMGFYGDVKSTKVTAKNNGKEIPIKLTKFSEKTKDSLQIFFPLSIKDSLEISIENGSYRKQFTSKLKNFKEADSLSIENKTGNVLSFRNSFILKTKTPLNSIDESKIFIRKKDSTLVKFTSKYDEFNQEIAFDFTKEEDQKYLMEILPGAIKDFYDTSNDSIKFDFSTRLLSDYGNLKINLIGAKRFPLILEILDDKGEVLYSQTSTKETSLMFETIEPKLYTLRVIYDDNANGIWDTGDYLAKKQAEEIIYFLKQVDVRANWDVEQEFGLD